ncbi:brain-specific serine protease 4-like [Maniola jurtina]|uniref:brain-specific serine protease 4-like n=1 Tax=Maniola jurtina TaxID=191418 RepID=UPI001E6889E9|nr:brain-specific serine protease 4-like [Maniola jurtina]
MCNDCCKEFTGWCKSFTKTEVFLCVLQAIFLVVFIAFLTFLILHLVVCSKNKGPVETEPIVNTKIDPTEDTNTDENYKESESSTDSVTTKNVIHTENVTNQTETATLTEKSEVTVDTDIPTQASTLDKAVKCTWKPSEKTKAFTHYYESDQSPMMTTKFDKSVVTKEIDEIAVENNMDSKLDDNKLLEDSTDGEEIHDSRKDFLVALVKIKPPQDVTFGCTLTVVSEYWTLTAASCIEAIEEVDSLDSFVMMRGFKEEKQNIHPVADVMIHPQYEGVNLTYDLAALKSETSLLTNRSSVVTLPSMIDYFLITIGERLAILGYGRFRNIDKDPLTRSVREVSVHSMPLSVCPTARATWSLRHLAGGAPVTHGACGASPICAGVLRARTSPCNYCSGTPLLNQDVLLGIMSDNQHCGLSCEPALFVNLALVTDWLQAVLGSD